MVSQHRRDYVREYARLNRQKFPSATKEYDNKETYRKYNAEKRERPYRSYEFIGYDGEGINSCGSDEPCGEIQYYPGSDNTRTFRNHKFDCQKYALLMNSKGDKIIDIEGLDTERCLHWLTTMKQLYPKAIHVIYGGSYDANMILKLLPYEDVLRLVKTGRTYYGDYRIAYVNRKYLQISRYNPRERGDKRKRKADVTITLWDVIGFFQGSFVTSLKSYFSDEEIKALGIEEIISGKARRSNFVDEELKDIIIPYTKKEVEALVAMMGKLRANMIEAGIHLERHDGAGAAAAALLGRKYNVKQYYADLPPEVELAAQVAYSGGRIEMLKLGYTDDYVYHYDLIGAYPSFMPLLPTLAGGEWIHATSNILPLTDNTLYKVFWDYDHRYRTDGSSMGINRKSVLYPFFYRQPWNEPRVFYPASGYSWVWTPELRAALKHNDEFLGKITLFEKWQFVPSTDYRPFAFVNDLYEKRLEYKRKGMGAQLALKLAINSFYGKMAQTVGYVSSQGARSPGYNADRRPPFYNLAYAGLITSYTRAAMFNAAMVNPKAVIAIATDGIWATEPLHRIEFPNGMVLNENSPIRIGEKLGDWEYERLENMTSVQAGIYFYTTADGKKVHRYRGFNQGSITEEAIHEAWRNNQAWLAIDSKRFITMGSAIASKERFESQWRVWDHSPRVLTIFPMAGQKRTTDYGIKDIHYADTQLLDTTAVTPHYFKGHVKGVRSLTEEFLSRKHPLPWDYDEATGDSLDEEAYAMQREYLDADI